MVIIRAMIYMDYGRKRISYLNIEVNMHKYVHATEKETLKVKKKIWFLIKKAIYVIISLCYLKFLSFLLLLG